MNLRTCEVKGPEAFLLSSPTFPALLRREKRSLVKKMKAKKQRQEWRRSPRFWEKWQVFVVLACFPAAQKAEAGRCHINILSGFQREFQASLDAGADTGGSV